MNTSIVKKLFIKKSFNLAFVKQCRSFLSQSYHCEDAWNQRLNDPLIKDIQPVDFYYGLIRKFKKDGKISAIDADLLINRIELGKKESLIEEMEEVVRLVRRSPETVKTLPSTGHAVMRLLVKSNETDLMLKMVSDPTNYGIFPSHYLANLLMNHFIREKDFTGCSRVASGLMLQEDFGPPLTRALCLYSCIMYAFNGEGNAPWVEYNPVEQPEDEVKIRVPYIRNPYFDDHFDIKVPEHIVGKTLAWLSYGLDASPDIKCNAKVLGWALYQKYEKLSPALEECVRDKNILDDKVMAIVSKSIENCEDTKLKTDLEKTKGHLESLNLIKPSDIESQINQLVKDVYVTAEQEDIAKQLLVYDSWKDARQVALQKELSRLERLRLIDEISAKKKYLKDKEEVLFFFDHKLKLELKYAVKKAEEVETATQEEEEYVVPELR